MQRLESERKTRAQERAALLEQLSDFRSRSESTQSRITEISGLRDELENRASQALQRVEQTTAEMTSRQEEHSIMQHRFSSLEEVERRRSNYSEGVQKFLSTQLPGEESAANQTLADHIETDAPYETAVEDYMNDPLQYILVGGMKDAVQSVGRVKKIGAGKCTFLALRNGHIKESPKERPRISGEGVVGYLDQILRMRDDVKDAFERVLPDYASTVMVHDLDTAFRVAESNPGLSFLTLEGEAYSPRGMLSAVGERKSMAGFLALKREKRELKEKLSALRQKLESIRATLGNLKEDHRTLADSLSALSEESRELDIEAVVLKHHLARLEGEIQKVGQTEQVVETELGQLKSEKSEYGSKLQEVRFSIGDIEERSRSGDEEMQSLTSRLASLKTESSYLSKTLSEMTSAQAVRRERLSGMETELRRLASESEEVARRLESNEAEQAEISVSLEELERSKQEAEVEIEDLDRDLQQTEKSLEENQQTLESQRQALNELEEAIRQHHADREEAMAARSKIEIEKTRLETDLEHLEKSCIEEFQLKLEEVKDQIQEDDWKRDFEEVSIS
jgi:chromosome segregation protein